MVDAVEWFEEVKRTFKFLTHIIFLLKSEISKKKIVVNFKK